LAAPLVTEQGCAVALPLAMVGVPGVQCVSGPSLCQAEPENGWFHQLNDYCRTQLHVLVHTIFIPLVDSF
jgi:hypothetical protein